MDINLEDVIDIIEYKQAKKLKELGLPQKHYEYLYLDGELITKDEYDEMDCGGPFSYELAQEETISIPPLYIIQEWLRENKGIHICPIYSSLNLEKPYVVEINETEITFQDCPGYTYPMRYESYSKALRAGINETLESL